MTQSEVNQMVADATGENVNEIRLRGFSIADPMYVNFDPEPEDLPTGHTNGNNRHTKPAGGTATQSQLRAIFAIARRQQLNLQNIVRDRFNLDRPEDLSIREASSLIDDLKQRTTEVRS